MGWRDRDWAKFTDAEREALWGTGGHTRGRRGYAIRRTHSAWVAALASLALFVAGQLPRANPLLPGLRISLPVGSPQAHKPHVFRLEGPRIVQHGSVFTVSGRAGGAASGVVRIDIHWNAWPWENVYTGPLGSGGTYRAEIPLQKLGRLNIRVLLPNGDQIRGSVRVVG
jgi:hypothetical protein